jgi:hypothetical protein
MNANCRQRGVVWVCLAMDPRTPRKYLRGASCAAGQSKFQSVSHENRHFGVASQSANYAGKGFIFEESIADRQLASRLVDRRFENACGQSASMAFPS